MRTLQSAVLPILLGCVLGAQCTAVRAGAFNLAPTRLELSGARRVAALTLRNQDSQPVLVQAQAFAWSQPGGQDHYEDTRDLLVTPAVFEVAPGAEQVVRVVLRRAPDETLELSYRVYLQEVPQAHPDGGNGVNIALRLGVPVFVAALKPVAAQLAWQLLPLPDGRLQLLAVNNGGTHARLGRFDVEFGSDKVPVDGGRYLLPGSDARWSIAPPASLIAGVMPAVRGISDAGDFLARVSNSAP